MTLFLSLIFGHFLADYPLQGDFLARGKNHKNPIPGVPWYQCLFAHAVIHGGVVGYITGHPMLGVAEFFAHGAIDWAKSEGIIGFNHDQALHIVCKILWVAMISCGCFA